MNDFWYFITFTYGPWDDNFHCALMSREDFYDWCARRNNYLEQYSGTEKSDFIAQIISPTEMETLNKWLFNFGRPYTLNFPIYADYGDKND